MSFRFLLVGSLAGILSCASAPRVPLPSLFSSEAKGQVGGLGAEIYVRSGGGSPVMAAHAPPRQAQSGDGDTSVHTGVGRALTITLHPNFGETHIREKRRLWAASTLTHRLPDGREEVIEGLLDRHSENSLQTGVRYLHLELSAIFDMSDAGEHPIIWRGSQGSLRYVVHVLAELDYLMYRLAHDQSHNGWALYGYSPDHFYGLAAATIAHGDAAIARLTPFLDDGRVCDIVGSREATGGFMYAHRRSDYAAMMLAKLLGLSVPELLEMSHEARDVGIERVRDAVD